MTNYNATAIQTEVDQNRQSETTTYWFAVQSEDYRIESGEYGIADCNGELTPLNEDGAPVDYNETLRSAVLATCKPAH